MSAVLKKAYPIGWEGKIDIEFGQQAPATRTNITSVSHHGPLRIQRPFYPEDEVCHVYLLHPPGGVVGGDSLEININCKTNSHALITTPGSTKFYRSAGAYAQLTQTLTVEKNSTLEWFPQENIFFPGAKVKARTNIYIEENANFIGWEINCFGRPANNEKFNFGKIDNCLTLYYNNKIWLIERQRIFEKHHLTAAAGLRGYPMNALLLCTACSEASVDLVRNVIDDISPDFPVGVTLLDDILILRALGNSTEKIQAVLKPVWEALRPIVLHKKAIKPRIWST